MLTAESALRKDRTTQATLEHRHFAFIAAMPDHAPSLRAQKRPVAMAFVQACVSTNPRFDRARFLRACGEAE